MAPAPPIQSTKLQCCNDIFDDNHPFDQSKRCKTRVELHLHLDGSVRRKTMFELAQKKKFRFTIDNTFEEFEKALTIAVPSNLAHFLSKLEIYMPLLVGDLEVLERIAYELCEDQAAEQVIYFEARYSPHLFSNTVKHFFNPIPVAKDHPNAVTPKDAIMAVYKGFQRGEKDFDIKVSSILCAIKGQPGWSSEVVNLASELATSAGVVGIDIAGDESVYTAEETAMFEKAKQLGIHRTVHAGEMGPAANVQYAVKNLFAERVGHGYHVVQDSQIYQMCKANDVHFETCPHSSYLTGSIGKNVKHPIVIFAEDNVNFSINKDDATVTKKTLDDEYRLLAKKGLSEIHFVRANLNAARSCFLPENEKKKLIERIHKAYGFIHSN